MATESSPFPAEEEIESELYEELLILLALSFVYGVNGVVVSTFSYSDFSTTQDRFRAKASEAVAKLSKASYKAIQVGVERTRTELRMPNLVVDLSDQRFSTLVNSVFSSNIERMLQTNQSFFEELLRIADEKGWSDEELARRLKRYYGLTPRFLRTVIAMEDALVNEGVSKKSIAQRVNTRVNQLIDTRLKLAATLLGTEIVEGSKEAAFTHLVETDQIDTYDYVKEWVSVIDDVTTQVCLSSHNMIAEIGQPFPNGFYHPPATDPVHPCRSSLRIRKRPS